MNKKEQPRSLRSTEVTEKQITMLSALKGIPVTELIRGYVRTGLDEATRPENVSKIVEEKTRLITEAATRLAALAVDSEVSPPDTES